MATDMDRAYCEWSHEEISSRSESREVSVTQILDHGSISFGRFSVDSLSWEKWSVFPHNRRLEEVEKFKTPGLVAQKKAYFEAYYKRIRALKALQDQQSETTLDSEGNGIVHSRASEEEHDIMQEENTISETAIVANQKKLPEENAIEVSIERETCNDAPLLQNLEVETTVSYPDSSRISIDDVSIEEIEQHRNEWKTIEIEEVSTDKERSITIVEVVTSAQGTLPEDMGSIEKRDSNCESTGSHSSSRVESKTKRFKDAPSIPKDKGAALLRNPRGLKPNYIHKEAVATSAKSNQKMERKTKTDVKSSQVPKYPPHRPTGKAGTVVNSNKPTSDQTSSSKKLTSFNSGKTSANMVSSISKSTNGSISSKATSNKVRGGGTFASISSDRPAAEACSKVTIPRPFSFSTERRPTAPAHAGEVTRGYSDPKSSKRLSHTNKSLIDIAVTRGMTNTGPAAGRNHEAVRKSTFESRSTISKAKNVEYQKQIVRSSHTSARSISNQYGGNQSSLRHDDRNQVKAESSLKQSQPSSKLPASSLPTSSRTRVTKPDNRKIVPSRSLDLTRDGRKPGRGNPCWR